MTRLLPPSTIGIIGGGQLGQMMAMSALTQGYRIAVLDPDPTCPARSVSHVFIEAAYDDPEAFAKLCELSDVVTYEFENVDATLVAQHHSKIPQGAKALEVSQHRYAEKRFARSLGIPTPGFWHIQSRMDLLKLDTFPLILKTCRWGYDGKGQIRINSREELEALNLDFPGDYIAEEVIPFTREISVVVTRFSDGTSAYEAFENTHRNGILHTSLHPAHLDYLIQEAAVNYAKAIAEATGYIGTLAVEYFLVRKQLVFNEFAPRPHNSAHGTIEGCDFSQFDQHVAAITGASVRHPQRNQATSLLNILGQDLKEALKEWQDRPFLHLHLYGKTEARTNRKMGHLVFACTHPSQARAVVTTWRQK